jgi:hypothetical protein
MKRTVRGFTPTLPSSDIIIIFKEPPILKFEDFVMLAWFRVKHSKNRSMVTFHHRQIVNHGIRKNRAPFRVSKKSVKPLIRPPV